VRKELLVNASPPETRVALTEDGRVVEVLHERRGRQGLVGNVYLGRVHRVLPGMQAAFVTIGLDRDAFLYVEDAAAPATEFDFGEDDGDAEGRGAAASERARIDDLVKEGQEIVVQVRKDPIGAKGPRVTSSISLPGRNLVYLPGSREIGVSRRLTDDAERERLRDILQGLAADGGLIARTAAAGKSAAELETDRAYLTGLAARIQKRRESASPPALLHRELDLSLRALRDLAPDDVDAIQVDDPATRDRMAEFLESAAPALARRLELYDEPTPLFDRFGVEPEIENALKSRVGLPSGGSIVIHQTEALVAIDVNTGRYVGREDLEETVFAANMEAAPEIARQIRLRDLGGLLVVDFIDMEDPEHRRTLFEAFEAELSRDRSRTRVLQISEFGLVEITRQRSRGNLERVLTRSCPCCAGSGRVKTDLTVALDLRRTLLAPPSLFTPGETVRVRVRPGVARTLAEEGVLADAERALGIRVEPVEDASLREKSFEIERG
jgi:ribonuclease G